MLELLVRDDGDTAAEERRHNEGEFMSKFISVRDLMNQTKAKFMEMHKEGVVYDSCREYQYAKQNQLVDKDKDHMVMPCEETVYLAFVPSNPFSEAAARLTGRVGLTRAVQRRSLTREHVDTHYCHKIRKNVREWVILVVKVCDECKLDADKFAADFSLDDKAKVSVGEPGHPATAGARPNNKAIVGVGQELRCADHDTGVVANVVPAVQLRMDLPKNTTDPRTKGKVVVYLRDGVFDGSDPWKHAVELCVTIFRQAAETAGVECTINSLKQFEELDEGTKERIFDKVPRMLTLSTDGKYLPSTKPNMNSDSNSHSNSNPISHPRWRGPQKYIPQGQARAFCGYEVTHQIAPWPHHASSNHTTSMPRYTMPRPHTPHHKKRPPPTMLHTGT